MGEKAAFTPELKFPLRAPVFNPHPEYREKNVSNATSRQSYLNTIVKADSLNFIPAITILNMLQQLFQR